MKIDHNNSATFSQKKDYKVPFGTVSVTDKARELINAALDSKWVTRGKYVQDFEERFAALFGVKYGIAVSSGTDADAICCAALYDMGARRGDEVIVPALTFIASANAVCQAGLTPVFVDVKRETLNIDPEKIEQAITPKTRAIMVVHLMGKPAEMKAIKRIAQKHELAIIEDAAEAHGAKYHGELVGTLGDMSAYSLYAAHIVTTIEGGIILTDNDVIVDAARSLRNHGMVNKFEFSRIGFSAKMNEIEAAVGLGNLDIFQKILDQRCQNLAYLIKQFKKYEEYFYVLKEEDHEKIGPHAFSIVLKENVKFSKDEFVRYIEEQGVDSRNLFYSIPTQCRSYEFLGHKLGDFPEAEYCANNGTHIGIHQDLGVSQLDHVTKVVDSFLAERG